MGSQESISLKPEEDGEVNDTTVSSPTLTMSQEKGDPENPKLNLRRILKQKAPAEYSLKSQREFEKVDYGEAAEISLNSEVKSPDAPSSKSVVEECPRSVRLNPLGTLVKLPASEPAVSARESHQQNKAARMYDIRTKQLVDEVIYKEGGYLISRKGKKKSRDKRIKIEPGTLMPSPPARSSSTITGAKFKRSQLKSTTQPIELSKT